MSWSIKALYRSVNHAALSVEANPNLPPTVKAYIGTGLAGIEKKDGPVFIEGSGHLCYEGAGGGNYQQTTCNLKVEPLDFAPGVQAVGTGG